jgi:hypothetical protein
MKLRVGILVVVLLVLGSVGIYEFKASAQTQLTTACVVNVPAEWGEFKGISRYYLVFEAKDGTLRMIDQMPCSIDRNIAGVPNVAVEVRRTK